MDAFYYAHKAFINSCLFLTLALMLLGYSMLYTRVDQVGRDVRVVVQPVNAANEALRQREKEEKAKSVPESEDGEDTSIRSMPVFLNRINEIAKTNDVVIEHLTPVDTRLNKFSLSFKSDYETFVGFIGGFEQLNVEINDLQVRPYEAGSIPPVHFIQFSITPRNDAERMEGARLTALRAQIQRRNKRNPFQRFAFHADAVERVPLIDLTWINKLTGIGSRNGKSYATIDRLDFTVGEEFDGKEIKAIEPNRVLLEERTGTGVREFVLKFREQL